MLESDPIGSIDVGGLSCNEPIFPVILYFPLELYHCFRYDIKEIYVF